jgi:hypothetical protein
VAGPVRWRASSADPGPGSQGTLAAVEWGTLAVVEWETLAAVEWETLAAAVEEKTLAVVVEGETLAVVEGAGRAPRGETAADRAPLPSRTAVNQAWAELRTSEIPGSPDTDRTEAGRSRHWWAGLPWQGEEPADPRRMWEGPPCPWKTGEVGRNLWAGLVHSWQTEPP